MEGHLIKLFFICIFVLFFNNEVIVSASNLKIVIDHDGGADDAMAIFIALLREKYFKGPQVVGLTTTHGNVNETQSFNNTQRILGVINRRDVPIYRGYADSIISSVVSDYFFGYDGLGDNDNVTYLPIQAKPQHAVHALINFSKQYQGNLTVIAIGALTNIAQAIRFDPGFLGRLSHLYVGAGNVNGTTVFTFPEFNAQMDVEAYRIITQVATPDKVTFVPFSQIYNMNITKTWRLNVLGEIFSSVMLAQKDFERKSLVYFPNSPKWALLDPVVVSIVEKPSLVNQRMLTNNTIILCGDQRGININNFVSSKDQANSNLIYAVNETLYMQFLVDTFSVQATISK